MHSSRVATSSAASCSGRQAPQTMFLRTSTRASVVAQQQLQRAGRRCSRPAAGVIACRAALRKDDSLELEAFLQLYKQRNPAPAQAPGEVYLIGTGPGDPGLLTLRAAQLMQQADVVLYDRLVSEDILRLVHPGARMVYVGKQAGFHTRSQTEIHDLLVAFADAGALVIRLKGGDPYVFGRGGEEVAHLQANGIEVHCVPGITAASGICAELGIPMTHRGVATSVRFLTGHSREGGEEQLDATWAVAGDQHTTLVVYMGLGMLPSLAAQLAEGGMPDSTPAVAVERGTTAARRVVYGTVSELSGRALGAGLKSPTLIVIGEVVALSPGWAQWDAAGRPLTWNKASSYPEMPSPEAFAVLASSGGAAPAALTSAPAGAARSPAWKSAEGERKRQATVATADAAGSAREAQAV